MTSTSSTATTTTATATNSATAERKVLLAGKVLDKDKNDENKRLYSLIENQVDSTTDVWFNSVNELNDWLKSGGKLEGIGVWNGKWLNYRNKGPIIWGEEHSDDKNKFIKALHISNYLFESASEDSIPGHDRGNAESENEILKQLAHLKNVTEEGHELENKWLKLAGGVARFFQEVPESIKKLGQRRFQNDNYWYKHIIDLSETSGSGKGRWQELIEGVEKLKTVSPAQVASSNQGEDAAEITKTVQALQNLIQHMVTEGWNELIQGIINKNCDFPQIQSAIKEGKIKPQALGTSMETLLNLFKQLGEKMFLVVASDEEKQKDATIQSTEKEPLKQWALRREVYQMRNIRQAFSGSNPPVLTVMGIQHATNQEEALKEILKSFNGNLIKSPTIDAVVQYGEKP